LNFQYPIINTIDHNNQRWYCVDESTIYPSITTILGHTMESDKAASLEDWRNRIGHEAAEEICRSSVDRGSAVHRLIELYLIDKNSPEFKEEFLRSEKNHAQMFNSVKTKLNRVDQVWGQEVALHSSTLGVAGRCDCIGVWEKIPSIIDFKTSRRVKTAADIADYWLQIAFYARAHNEMFGTNITQGVVLMGVNEQPAMIFKKQLDQKVYSDLINRVNTFYRNENDKII